jgi:hypothetical protein
VKRLNPALAKAMFSPILVAAGSRMIRSGGTPRASSSSAKISASVRENRSLVQWPRLPVARTRGASPLREIHDRLKAQIVLGM